MKQISIRDVQPGYVIQFNESAHVVERQTWIVFSHPEDYLPVSTGCIEFFVLRMADLKVFKNMSNAKDTVFVVHE